MRNLILIVVLFLVGNLAIAEESLLHREGKELYLQYCNSCHGDAVVEWITK